LGERGVKGFPDQVELVARGFELLRVLGLEAGPSGVGAQAAGAGLPSGDVGAQGFALRLRLGQRLGREQLDALRQQHRGLALHLHLVLQVFERLHARAQGQAQTGQRLARQRCPGFGGLALPAHGVGQVEARLGQQGLRFGCPLFGDRVLGLDALELVEFVLERLGRTFVAVRELAVDLGHLLDAGLAGEPLAQPGGALARGRGLESPSGQGVELRQVGGGWGGLDRGVHGFGGGRQGDARTHVACGARAHQVNRDKCRFSLLLSLLSQPKWARDHKQIRSGCAGVRNLQPLSHNGHSPGLAGHAIAMSPA